MQILCADRGGIHLLKRTLSRMHYYNIQQNADALNVLCIVLFVMIHWSVFLYSAFISFAYFVKLQGISWVKKESNKKQDFNKVLEETIPGCNKYAEVWGTVNKKLKSYLRFLDAQFMLFPTSFNTWSKCIFPTQHDASTSKGESVEV